ncbi:unnamed protein product [Dicrocoelium dendriticum]|nr:unnamed protein product [Dicrocoelium dendriticum]
MSVEAFCLNFERHILYILLSQFLHSYSCTFAAFVLSGFRPRRTIVLASWDGEELSLLGSTHMVEERNNELRQRAVAYINTDCPIKGGSKFRARTDELLADVLFLASRFVKVDPPLNTNTLFDEWLAQNEEPSQSEPR